MLDSFCRSTKSKRPLKDIPEYNFFLTGLSESSVIRYTEGILRMFFLGWPVFLYYQYPIPVEHDSWKMLGLLTIASIIAAFLDQFSWIVHDCAISNIFAYSTQLTKYRILYGIGKNSLNLRYLLETMFSILNFPSWLFVKFGFTVIIIYLWGPNIYIASVKKSSVWMERDLWFNRERDIFVGNVIYKLEVPPNISSFLAVCCHKTNKTCNY
jgi:hypothetical protein